jgi:hypothetical protein
VKSFIDENKEKPTNTAPTSSIEPKNNNLSNNNSVIIGATLGSILGVILLGSIGFFAFKRYKKTTRHKTPEFTHVLGA